MDIQTKVLQHRDQLAAAVVVSVAVTLFLYAAPRFLNIVAYFWPLFASTAVLLVAMAAFGGGFKLSTEVHGVKAGEGILNYVAGQPEYSAEYQHKYE